MGEGLRVAVGPPGLHPALESVPLALLDPVPVGPI